VRVLAIVHQLDAGPGVFRDAIAAAGAELDEWLLPGGRPPPRDPAAYEAVMTFGGAMHADQDREHPWLAEEKTLLADLLARRTPLLGVCLGAQLIAEAAGGRARRLERGPEIGWYEVRKTDEARDDPLLAPLPARFEALEWHSYEFSLPAGAVALASSDGCLQACRLADAAWGIQFHAEVTLGDFEAWVDDYRSDAEAVAKGIDPEALRAQTRAGIARWNALGRGLCERFLAVAGARAQRLAIAS
jgi:GMP synthase-like glutamine amidotransferase